MWKFVFLACVSVALASGPCTQKNADTKKKQDDAIAEGHFIADLPFYNCEADGLYARVQCMGGFGYCYCAAKDGTFIGKYNNDHLGEGVSMTCNCARDFFEYQQTGLIGKTFSCDDAGNYHSVQCLGSGCFCADEFGKNTGNNGAVSIGEVDSLHC